MKKLLSGLFITALCVSALSTAAFAEDVAETETTENEFGVLTEISGENGTTYANLFAVILDEKYDDYWVEKAAEIVGEENAAEMTEMLKGYISCDIYGQEAVDAYADAEGFGFDCYYINDVDSFEFNGDQVTTYYTDGSESTHEYTYLGKMLIGEGETMVYQGTPIDPAFECDVYESTDDAGESTYFFFRDDTMETTYHIEFRYGSDLEQLQKYLEGEYAYWLAAGIDADTDEETIHNVIDLFVTENLH